MSLSQELGPPNVPFFPNIFLKNQFRSKPPHIPPDTDLIAKVAIVTGANSGLGFEACVQLLSLRLSHLILAVRSTEKGNIAASKLRAQCRDAAIEVWELDMNSYQSIQEFSQRVNSQLSRLDYVILNAGISNFRFRVNTSTGHEEVIQVNYLSTALLSLLLIPACLKVKVPTWNTRPIDPGERGADIHGQISQY
jgi:NAD(P)-dependent dehydrogenase (short-subunit alcohol dehydrogenase family)